MTRSGVWAATLPLLLLALNGGCGRDPILEAAEKAEQEAAAAAGEGGAQRPSPEGVPGETRRANVGDPQPGTAAEPTPGTPAEPTPAAPGSPDPAASGAPTPGVPDPPKPGIPEEPTPGLPGTAPPIVGPTVKVSGTIRYAGYKSGTVRITAFDGDHSAHGTTPPKVVGQGEATGPGSFSFDLPQDAGKVYVEAVIDEDGDGRPGPLDPQGKADRYPVTVRTADIGGLTIAVEKREPPPTGARDDF